MRKYINVSRNDFQNKLELNKNKGEYIAIGAKRYMNK